MNKQNKAFTLVELIVVITIVSILWTIAFISLQWYWKSARDSTRLSDLSAMKTSLELFYLNAWKYPDATDWFNVTYSWSTVWTQWTFWNSTISNVDKLDKIPTDPLTWREYTYSITNTKQEFQLAWLMETDELSNTLFENKVLAWNIIATAIVTWNYNWKLVKTLSWVNCEILSLPSIISSQPNTTTNLMDILSNTGLVYNWFNNLPSNYITSKYKSDWWFNFVSNRFVAYADSSACKPLYNTEDNSARITLVTNLKEAYAWTIIENQEEINELITIDLSDTNATDFVSATLINNNLWWDLEIVYTSSTGWGWWLTIILTQEDVDVLNALANNWDLRASDSSYNDVEQTIEWWTNTYYLEWYWWETIPLEIFKLQNLKELYLSWNSLTTLPSEIWQLTNLSHLWASDNQLQTLPLELTNLNNLTEIDFVWNTWLGNLSDTFTFVSDYKSQENITINGDTISIFWNGTNVVADVVDYPLNWKCWLHDWRDLYFTPTKLCTIWLPSVIVDNWEWFTFDWTCNWVSWWVPTNCSANHITPNLTQAEADELNTLTWLNYTIEQRLPIETLNLWYKSLTTLPTWMFDLIYLKYLFINGNQLSVLPPEIWNLVDLINFRLYTNNFTSLPPEIWNLIYVETLDISGNSLTSIPPEIWNLHNIKSLYLWGGDLSTLPPEIWNLLNLTFLSISGQLISLPSEIWNLVNLKQLSISYNSLTSLPSEIWNLSNLEYLRLKYNQLSLLPSQLSNLKKLAWFDLTGNDVSLWDLNNNFNLSSPTLSQSNITPEGYTMEIWWNGKNVIINVY